MKTAKIHLPTVLNDNGIPQYVRLVRRVIRDAPNGRVLIVKEKTGYALIRSHTNDFLGDVQVPLSALRQIQ